MKRTVFALLMVAGAVALFANGNAEAPNAGDRDFGPPADAEFTPIELTGTVSIVDGHAVLTADGQTYLLAIPRIAWYADAVADGTAITVTGHLVLGVEHDQVNFDGDGYIAVQQVEIDGEVFALGGRGGPVGRFDVAGRGRFDDSDDDFGRGRYDDDDFGRRMPRRGADDFGRGQMPRGRRI